MTKRIKVQGFCCGLIASDILHTEKDRIPPTSHLCPSLGSSFSGMVGFPQCGDSGLIEIVLICSPAFWEWFSNNREKAHPEHCSVHSLMRRADLQGFGPGHTAHTHTFSLSLFPSHTHIKPHCIWTHRPHCVCVYDRIPKPNSNLSLQ